MKADTEYLSNCPTCFPDEVANIGNVSKSNAHLVRVWVTSNGETDPKISDESRVSAASHDAITFELDGTSSSKIRFPDFLTRSTSRGTTINILMQAEQCDHFWIKQIYFHKGDVFEIVYGVEESKIRNFFLREMSRD